jgi:hypothetical protein
MGSGCFGFVNQAKRRRGVSAAAMADEVIQAGCSPAQASKPDIHGAARVVQRRSGRALEASTLRIGRETVTSAEVEEKNATAEGGHNKIANVGDG